MGRQLLGCLILLFDFFVSLFVLTGDLGWLFLPVEDSGDSYVGQHTECIYNIRDSKGLK